MNKTSMKKLLSYLKRHISSVALSFLLAVVSVAISLYIPIMLGHIVMLWSANQQ